jgi:hypothetical protein
MFLSTATKFSSSHRISNTTQVFLNLLGKILSHFSDQTNKGRKILTEADQEKQRQTKIKEY